MEFDVKGEPLWPPIAFSDDKGRFSFETSERFITVADPRIHTNYASMYHIVAVNGTEYEYDPYDLGSLKRPITLAPNSATRVKIIWPQRVSVWGKVLDLDMNPIPNARLSQLNSISITDHEGRFSFRRNLSHLPLAGRRRNVKLLTDLPLTVEAEGYHMETFPVPQLSLVNEEGILFILSPK